MRVFIRFLKFKSVINAHFTKIRNKLLLTSCFLKANLTNLAKT